MTSYAVLGYSGGKAKAIADVPIHVQIGRHADRRGRPDDHRPYADAMAVRSARRRRCEDQRLKVGLRMAGHEKFLFRIELVFGRDLLRLFGCRWA